MGSHSVSCHPAEVIFPPLTVAKLSWYWIQWPRTDARLSRPRVVGGFCWRRVLPSTCPCWQQLVHLDYGKDARVHFDGGTYTVHLSWFFIPHTHISRPFVREVRDVGVLWWQWHQLDHMQTICTSLQTTTPTPHHSIFTGRMLFLMPSQQWQSSEGKIVNSILVRWK